MIRTDFLVYAERTGLVHYARGEHRGRVFLGCTGAMDVEYKGYIPILDRVVTCLGCVDFVMRHR